ncbi:hypothetical protein PHMEG_00021882 [Phytophthora megakarya]|uniref:Uncharacterized protein n=1 Tax=Phytophthora megakarya TaxID=4795 RepID=A0A225VK59_9STRA|nr:hypothetical protein PHMEG_00021882 [Phytophthora megakarya]
MTDAAADNVIFEVADAAGDADDIDTEQARVGGVTEADASTSETDVVERRVVFVADDRELTTQDLHDVGGHTTETIHEPHYFVRRSTQFAEKNEVLFARMCPHLFPMSSVSNGDSATQLSSPHILCHMRSPEILGSQAANCFNESTLLPKAAALSQHFAS